MSLRVVCCSANAAVLEMAQWVAGLMYLGGGGFFFLQDACGLHKRYNELSQNYSISGGDFYNSRICSSLTLTLAVGGVHHCSSPSAAV